MLVLCLSNCPPALRGDLTRWLQEIDVGVYAGHVSARIREELWARVVSNAKSGRATMVFSARNEQHMEFRVHNTEWTPIDFDGLQLMLRPHAKQAHASDLPGNTKGYAKAAAVRNAKKYSRREKKPDYRLDSYIVMDMETTGLSVLNDRIIEVGAVKVSDGEITDRFAKFVRYDGTIPQKVQELTGISDEMLVENGEEEKEVLRDLLAFFADLPIVMHNAAFDFNFLRQACRRCGLRVPTNSVTDTLALAKRSIDYIDNFSLSTIAAYFDIEPTGVHRSLDDCITTKHVYEKLIELL